MFQIKREDEIEIIRKKSKFITRAFKINKQENVKGILKDIKLKEKGAVHNCYAYRIINEGNVLEKKSDDGEPGGTAGAPMLAVLKGEDVVNILVVTTRYFGGIKLGTGGLVNVYKHGVKEILIKCGKIDYRILNKWQIIFSIKETKNIEYLLKKENICINKKIFADNVIYIIEVSKEKEEKIMEICTNINGKIIKL